MFAININSNSKLYYSTAQHYADAERPSTYNTTGDIKKYDSSLDETINSLKNLSDELNRKMPYVELGKCAGSDVSYKGKWIPIEDSKIGEKVFVYDGEYNEELLEKAINKLYDLGFLNKVKNYYASLDNSFPIVKYVDLILPKSKYANCRKGGVYNEELLNVVANSSSVTCDESEYSYLLDSYLYMGSKCIIPGQVSLSGMDNALQKRITLAYFAPYNYRTPRQACKNLTAMISLGLSIEKLSKQEKEFVLSNYVNKPSLFACPTNLTKLGFTRNDLNVKLSSYGDIWRLDDIFSRHYNQCTALHIASQAYITQYRRFVKKEELTELDYVDTSKPTLKGLRWLLNSGDWINLDCENGNASTVISSSEYTLVDLPYDAINEWFDTLILNQKVYDQLKNDESGIEKIRWEEIPEKAVKHIHEKLKFDSNSIYIKHVISSINDYDLSSLEKYAALSGNINQSINYLLSGSVNPICYISTYGKVKFCENGKTCQLNRIHKIVSILLNHGADANSICEQSQTVLSEVTSYDYPKNNINNVTYNKIIKLLLDAGSDPNAVFNFMFGIKYTPLDYTAHSYIKEGNNNDITILQLFIDYGGLPTNELITNLENGDKNNIRANRKTELLQLFKNNDLI